MDTTTTTAQPADKGIQVFLWAPPVKGGGKRAPRPCIVTGESVKERPRIGGKWRGTYTVTHVEFIDGLEPRLAMPGKITWCTQSKLARGAEAIIWSRTWELVHDAGLDHADARRQAVAEFSKGVLG